MNIADTENLTDWLRHRDESITEASPVLPYFGKVSDWTGQDTIEACQPPF